MVTLLITNYLITIVHFFYLGFLSSEGIKKSTTLKSLLSLESLKVIELFPPLTIDKESDKKKANKCLNEYFQKIKNIYWNFIMRIIMIKK